MGVCSVDDGSSVDENCPVYAKGASPSQDKILAAEEQVFKVSSPNTDIVHTQSTCVLAKAAELCQHFVLYLLGACHTAVPAPCMSCLVRCCRRVATSCV